MGPPTSRLFEAIPDEGSVQIVVTFSNHTPIIGETMKSYSKPHKYAVQTQNLRAKGYNLSNGEIDNKNSTSIILVGMDLGKNSPVLI